MTASPTSGWGGRWSFPAGQRLRPCRAPQSLRPPLSTLSPGDLGRPRCPTMGTHLPWNKPNNVLREPQGLSLAYKRGASGSSMGASSPGPLFWEPLAAPSASLDSSFTFKGHQADSAPLYGHCNLSEARVRGPVMTTSGVGVYLHGRGKANPCPQARLRKGPALPSHCLLQF